MYVSKKFLKKAAEVGIHGIIGLTGGMMVYFGFQVAQAAVNSIVDVINSKEKTNESK